jgi:hypothetical protein
MRVETIFVAIIIIVIAFAIVSRWWGPEPFL